MNGIVVVSYVALWCLVIFQSLVLLGLVRAAGESAGRSSSPPLQRLHEHLAGRPAPPFAASDLSGRLIDDASFAGREAVLLFVSPDCPTCGATLDELEALTRKARGNIFVFCRAGRGACLRLAEQYEIDAPVIADEDMQLSALFGVRVTPTAVLLDEKGLINSYGHPMRGSELVEMMRRADAGINSKDVTLHAG